mmetsp:Transcript_12348/g.28997  ORF Transcript_12348/g.28997 Transcript_12348/m.28997 type:complete len:91 (+) Transcript_12348:3086-3358(+)
MSQTTDVATRLDYDSPRGDGKGCCQVCCFAKYACGWVSGTGSSRTKRSHHHAEHSEHKMHCPNTPAMPTPAREHSHLSFGRWRGHRAKVW